jgi:hypothetical protein
MRLAEIVVVARVLVDLDHPNTPSEADFETAVWNSLCTPDNKSFGIQAIRVQIASAVVTEEGKLE